MITSALREKLSNDIASQLVGWGYRRRHAVEQIAQLRRTSASSTELAPWVNYRKETDRIVNRLTVLRNKLASAAGDDASYIQAEIKSIKAEYYKSSSVP